MRKKLEPKILLDADVISHFLKGCEIFRLPQIFPRRLVVVDTVKNELCKLKSRKNQFLNFIAYTKIEEIKLDDCTIEVIKEYSLLIKQGKGEGESACLAIAKFNKHFVASGNIKDIKDYCYNIRIKFMTTIDILIEAYKKGLMTVQECDDFIQLVRSKNSHLPNKKFTQLLKGQRHN